MLSAELVRNQNSGSGPAEWMFCCHTEKLKSYCTEEGVFIVGMGVGGYGLGFEREGYFTMRNLFFFTFKNFIGGFAQN